MRDSNGTQPIQFPRDVLVDRLATEARTFVEGPRGAVTGRQFAEDLQELPTARPTVFRTIQVIARAGNIGQTALRGLRQRTQQRDVARRVASHSACEV